jgi:membrane fusion protein (multidrug efflux system)
MQTIVKLGMAAGMLLLVSCGGAGKQDSPDLTTKKTELQKLKKDQEKLAGDIQKLEAQIAEQDSSFAIKPKLVAITSLAPQNFVHFIDLQGKITTKNIFYVAPRGQGGQVKGVYVKEGDHVKQGELLMKLDDAMILQNKQQLETQLAYFKDIYSRQKNLWDQKIGTEVQLVTAKNNVDNVERQISVIEEQWKTSNIYSAVTGVVEAVNIHVGEFFTGAPNATISVVDQANMKASVEVPENYLPSVKKGTLVQVDVPDANKSFKSAVSLVSQLINSNSRSFTAEAPVPSDPALKPNQLALVKIQDYAASNTLVIPITTLQSDETGKYVFVLAKENGKPVAKRRTVQVGSVYGEKIEIKSGLQTGDQLITEGFQGLYDGQSIATS